jgi:hypothetical protein
VRKPVSQERILAGLLLGTALLVTSAGGGGDVPERADNPEAQTGLMEVKEIAQASSGSANAWCANLAHRSILTPLSARFWTTTR